MIIKFNLCPIQKTEKSKKFQEKSKLYKVFLGLLIITILFIVKEIIFL